MLFAVFALLYFGTVYMFMHWRMYTDYKIDSIDPTKRLRMPVRIKRSCMDFFVNNSVIKVPKVVKKIR